MEQGYLIDTSAYGRYLTGKLSDEGRLFIRGVLGNQSMMSIVTRIELLSWVTGNKELDTSVKEIISASSVLSLSEVVIEQTVRLRRHYKSVRLPDAIIAATAIVHNLTLLSTNASDFNKIQALTYKSLTA